MELKDRLINLMKEKGLNQSELADLSNVPRTTISRIIVGTAPTPRIDTVYALSKALKVSIEYLLGHEEAKLSTTKLAFYDQIESLTETELNDVSNYIKFVKSKRGV